MSLDTNVFDQYGNNNSLKLCNGKEFYIFIKYSDLMTTNKNVNIELGFHHMITEIEKEFQLELMSA